MDKVTNDTANQPIGRRGALFKIATTTAILALSPFLLHGDTREKIPEPDKSWPFPTINGSSESLYLGNIMTNPITGKREKFSQPSNSKALHASTNKSTSNTELVKNQPSDNASIAENERKVEKFTEELIRQGRVFDSSDGPDFVDGFEISPEKQVFVISSRKNRLKAVDDNTVKVCIYNPQTNIISELPISKFRKGYHLDCITVFNDTLFFQIEEESKDINIAKENYIYCRSLSSNSSLDIPVEAGNSRNQIVRSSHGLLIHTGKLVESYPSDNTVIVAPGKATQVSYIFNKDSKAIVEYKRPDLLVLNDECQIVGNIPIASAQESESLSYVAIVDGKVIRYSTVGDTDESTQPAVNIVDLAGRQLISNISEFNTSLAGFKLGYMTEFSVFDGETTSTFMYSTKLGYLKRTDGSWSLFSLFIGQNTSTDDPSQSYRPGENYLIVELNQDRQKKWAIRRYQFKVNPTQDNFESSDYEIKKASKLKVTETESGVSIDYVIVPLDDNDPKSGSIGRIINGQFIQDITPSKVMPGNDSDFRSDVFIT